MLWPPPSPSPSEAPPASRHGRAILLAAASGLALGAASMAPGRAEEGGDGAAAQVAEIAVVTNRANPVESLSDAELRRIFLRQILHWPGGERITVYERTVTRPIRRVFSRAVLGKEPAELKQYWLNLKLTRGMKPPQVLATSTVVKQYLQRVKGGISYIWKEHADSSVKVLRVLQVPGALGSSREGGEEP